jgi:hypothetical protein
MQTEIIDHRRRRILGAAAATIAAAQFSITSHASPQATTGLGRSAVLAPPKQVRAGALSVGYVEAGVPNGPTVILLMAGHTTSTDLSTSSRCSLRRDTG